MKIINNLNNNSNSKDSDEKREKIFEKISVTKNVPDKKVTIRPKVFKAPQRCGGCSRRKST